ncbi:hypothetical protein ACWGK1_28780 [Streptomyces wedmorensis]
MMGWLLVLLYVGLALWTSYQEYGLTMVLVCLGLAVLGGTMMKKAFSAPKGEEGLGDSCLMYFGWMFFGGGMLFLGGPMIIGIFS